MLQSPGSPFVAPSSAPLCKTRSFVHLTGVNGSSLPIIASFVHLTEAEGSALLSHLGSLGCKLLGALRRRDGSSSIHKEGTPRLRRRQPRPPLVRFAPAESSRELMGEAPSRRGKSKVSRGVCWEVGPRGEMLSVAWGTRRRIIGGRAPQGGDGRGWRGA